MPPLTGWQAQLVVSLQYIGNRVSNATAWIPNWAGAILFLLLLAGLVWLALRQARAQNQPSLQASHVAETTGSSIPDEQEAPVER